MSDTIERIFVTFIDIIHSSEKLWTEVEIHQCLHQQQYDVSRSQLNRDLNRYHRYFQVERLDKYNSDHATPVYKRKGKDFKAGHMTPAEFKLFTLISNLQDQDAIQLPIDSQELLNKKLQQLEKSKVLLFKNTPGHPIVKWSENQHLLHKYRLSQQFKEQTMNDISQCINDNSSITIQRLQFGKVNTDTLEEVSLFEKSDTLYLKGRSEFAGGVFVDFTVDSIIVTSTEDSKSKIKNAQDNTKIRR
ncbi:hypothetical protein QWY20_17510 [Alkalimonas sp. MEB108]|uniref:WYL domain-containing protein n=1 Tax=Alkalimonas cellulosilytica TaxID=3058395 RepID=A0ABU7J9M8_9GAMM|nr:hypothetical protein [Alkalimonas sp. MEB108]MEE2003253.1 hypothetical protein [Alkalimonas sp. MEB108]